MVCWEVGGGRVGGGVDWSGSLGRLQVTLVCLSKAFCAYCECITNGRAAYFCARPLEGKDRTQFSPGFFHAYIKKAWKFAELVR